MTSGEIDSCTCDAGLARLHLELSYAKGLLTIAERDRDQARRERGAEGRIDGDLLAHVIADACPAVLSDEAARETAERALSRLAGIEGVTVVRGPDSQPWTPDLQADSKPDQNRDYVVEAHICCEHAPLATTSVSAVSH